MQETGPTAISPEPLNNTELVQVIKLMSRIVAPEAFHDNNDTSQDDNLALSMHDHTYGITSDPLTQFACAFSALLHDCDHSGVPNTQVIQENPSLAELYQHRSVAEQNSVDLSWRLLMQVDFVNLRRAIYGNDVQAQARFRQLVVNAVMATDITDQELKKQRNSRWEKAFQEKTVESESDEDAVNRKATNIVKQQ